MITLEMLSGLFGIDLELTERHGYWYVARCFRSHAARHQLIMLGQHDLSSGNLDMALPNDMRGDQQDQVRRVQLL